MDLGLGCSSNGTPASGFLSCKEGQSLSPLPVRIWRTITMLFARDIRSSSFRLELAAKSDARCLLAHPLHLYLRYIDKVLNGFKTSL